MYMDLVRLWKDLCGLSPSLRPPKAWTVLTDLCVRFEPVGLPPLSCDAYVGLVCHCHCGGYRSSPVRLVWVRGSFGCPTIAASTQDLIVHMLPAFTSIYKPYLSAFKEFQQLLRNYYRFCGELESCGDPDPNVGLGRRQPPLQLSWVPAAMPGCDRAPRGLALRRRVKRFQGPHGS